MPSQSRSEGDSTLDHWMTTESPDRFRVLGEIDKVALALAEEAKTESKMKMKSFKEELTLDERLAESREIIAKYPTRIPVIAEKYSKTDLPAIEKKKFLVPRDMSVGQFIYILSARLHLSPGKALFVFVNNTLPQTAALMDSVYETYKDEDGFVYMCYSSEKTFG